MTAATVVQVLQDFEAPPTIAPRLSTTVAKPHIDRSLGSKETHIQSHNLPRRRLTTTASQHEFPRRTRRPPTAAACCLPVIWTSVIEHSPKSDFARSQTVSKAFESLSADRNLFYFYVWFSRILFLRFLTIIVILLRIRALRSLSRKLKHAKNTRC